MWASTRAPTVVRIAVNAARSNGRSPTMGPIRPAAAVTRVAIRASANSVVRSREAILRNRSAPRPVEAVDRVADALRDVFFGGDVRDRGTTGFVRFHQIRHQVIDARLDRASLLAQPFFRASRGVIRRGSGGKLECFASRPRRLRAPAPIPLRASHCRGAP